MINLLIVEDDIALCNGLSTVLMSPDYSIYTAYSLKSAGEFIAELSFDLIILDINLPDGSGLDFLKIAKAKTTASIILLTANDLETDIVIGLESGADDYITKPFSLSVLRARVNTQLRTKTVNRCFVQNEFVFDFEKMEFNKSGERIDLSKTEQKLLRLLTDNKGTVLKRDMLIDRIWTDGKEYVDENALSVTVKRLRVKLNDDECIKTIYGIGYKWVI